MVDEKSKNTDKAEKQAEKVAGKQPKDFGYPQGELSFDDLKNSGKNSSSDLSEKQESKQQTSDQQEESHAEEKEAQDVKAVQDKKEIQAGNLHSSDTSQEEVPIQRKDFAQQSAVERKSEMEKTPSLGAIAQKTEEKVSTQGI